MTAATGTSETATRFAQSIAALPPLPATAQEILTCFGDEFIDADKVTAVVDGDPGICAKLLGLANSAYFGLAEPVNTIGDAISRVLGVDTVRSLVLAMAIQQSFNSKGCPAFNTERFWIQSLLSAECCKKIAAADEAADEAVRDLAYSAGLCHNLGLLALVHMEPARTSAVLQAHSSQDEPDMLSKLFLDEFATDHKIMTAELARVWSLPQPMLAAYQYRAFPQSHCDERLGAVVAAAVVAVENTEVPEERQTSLNSWAVTLGLEAEDMQAMAVFTERQKTRVQSLASNMVR
ncbi:MAG: HDOD domain-containing protein [Gammaproteobacteria bacterium]|nr:HDOD domain-containing protein [Gammaproteobacteria bacterium]